MSIFCLPAELRDMVYKHIVAGHEIKMDPQPGRSAVAPPAEFATLQLISRQVQKESIAIYYGFNFSSDPLRRSDCIYRYDWTAKVSNDTVSGIGSASNTLGHVQCRTDTRTLRTSTRTYRPLETIPNDREPEMRNLDNRVDPDLCMDLRAYHVAAYLDSRLSAANHARKN
jgi:hypothetical protein